MCGDLGFVGEFIKEYFLWSYSTRQDKTFYNHFKKLVLSWLRRPKDKCFALLGSDLRYSVSFKHEVFPDEKEVERGNLSSLNDAEDPVSTAARGLLNPVRMGWRDPLDACADAYSFQKCSHLNATSNKRSVEGIGVIWSMKRGEQFGQRKRK